MTSQAQKVPRHHTEPVLNRKTQVGSHGSLGTQLKAFFNGIANFTSLSPTNLVHSFSNAQSDAVVLEFATLLPPAQVAPVLAAWALHGPLTDLPSSLDREDTACTLNLVITRIELTVNEALIHLRDSKPSKARFILSDQDKEYEKLIKRGEELLGNMPVLKEMILERCPSYQNHINDDEMQDDTALGAEEEIVLRVPKEKTWTLFRALTHVNIRPQLVHNDGSPLPPIPVIKAEITNASATPNSNLLLPSPETIDAVAAEGAEMSSALTDVMAALAEELSNIHSSYHPHNERIHENYYRCKSADIRQSSSDLAEKLCNIQGDYNHDNDRAHEYHCQGKSTGAGKVFNGSESVEQGPKTENIKEEEILKLAVQAEEITKERNFEDCQLAAWLGNVHCDYGQFNEDVEGEPRNPKSEKNMKSSQRGSNISLMINTPQQVHDTWW